MRDDCSVDDRRSIEIASDSSGDVGAVRTDGFRGVAVADRFVVEDLRGDDLVVGESRIAQLLPGRVARVIETRMMNVDAAIDDRHLDTGSGGGGPAPD